MTDTISMLESIHKNSLPNELRSEGAGPGVIYMQESSPLAKYEAQQAAEYEDTNGVSDEEKWLLDLDDYINDAESTSVSASEGVESFVREVKDIVRVRLGETLVSAEQSSDTISQSYGREEECEYDSATVIWYTCEQAQEDEPVRALYAGQDTQAMSAADELFEELFGEEESLLGEGESIDDLVNVHMEERAPKSRQALLPNVQQLLRMTARKPTLKTIMPVTKRRNLRQHRTSRVMSFKNVRRK